MINFFIQISINNPNSKFKPERAKTPERPKTPVERPKTPPPPPRTPTPPPPTPPPGEPISFVKELKSTSAMLGTKFTFTSTTNYADLEAVWYLNGEKIPIYKTMAEYNRTDRGQKFPFVTVKSKGNKHTLECEEAIERFAGTYTVEVSNEDGEKAKSEAQLKVLYEPPVFLKNLEDIHIDEGKKISFSCRIDDPNQEVVWYFRVSLTTLDTFSKTTCRTQVTELPISTHVTKLRASTSKKTERVDIRCHSLRRNSWKAKSPAEWILENRLVANETCSLRPVVTFRNGSHFVEAVWDVKKCGGL